MTAGISHLVGLLELPAGTVAAGARAAPLPRNAAAAVGTAAGTVPPGVSRPTIFGTATASAEVTTLAPRPSLLARLSMNDAGRASSTWGTVMGGAVSPRPSQTATRLPRPALLVSSMNPAMPPGRPVM